MSNFQLSESQVQAFHKRGVLCIDFAFDHVLLDTIIEKTLPLYDQNILKNKSPGRRIQDGWKQIEEIRQLAMNSSVLSALGQLFGRKAKPFQTLNFPIGTEQLAHSDSLHFNSVPKEFMVGVWTALENIDEDNGPLVYYPGSHKLKEYNMHSFRLGRGHDFYPQYEQAIQKIILKENLTPSLGLVPKGHTIIWHANLLHGGSSQKDLNRTRHSQVTHCYFDNCKYYTPLYSRFPLKQYREPIWIPDSPDYILPEQAYLPPTRWPIRLRRNIVSKIKKIQGLGKNG